MLVKMFQATGHKAIQDLENEINKWSGQTTQYKTVPDIKFVDTAMCQIGDAEAGERYQSYVVSVWYE